MNIKAENLVIDLLIDDNYINYVMNPTPLLIERWNHFFKVNPEYVQAADDAKKILLGESNQKSLNDLEVKELEIEIMEKCGLVHYN